MSVFINVCAFVIRISYISRFPKLLFVFIRLSQFIVYCVSFVGMDLKILLSENLEEKR